MTKNRYELNDQVSKIILNLLNEGKKIPEIYNVIIRYKLFKGGINTFRKRVLEAFEKHNYDGDFKWDYKRNSQNSFQIIMDFKDSNEEVYNEQLRYLEEYKIKSRKSQHGRKVIYLNDIRCAKINNSSYIGITGKDLDI